MSKPKASKPAKEPAGPPEEDSPDYCEVDLGVPRPNKMFPDWATERVLLLSYTKPVPCAHCGKLRKKHWTMLMAFSVATEPGPGDNPCVVQEFNEVHLPLTPVCGKHCLRPMLPKREKQAKEPMP